MAELKELKKFHHVDQIDFPLLTRPALILEIVCLVTFTIEFILRILSDVTMSFDLFFLIDSVNSRR